MLLNVIRLNKSKSHVLYFLFFSIYRSINLFSNLSIFLSIYISFHPSIFLSIYLSIHLSFHLYIFPSIFLSSHLNICISICLSVHLSFYPSIFLFKHPSILVFSNLSIYLLWMLSPSLSSLLLVRNHLWRTFGLCQRGQGGATGLDIFLILRNRAGYILLRNNDKYSSKK